MKSYRINAIIIGALFIITMLSGMIDAYFVSPGINVPLDSIYEIKNLIFVGVFSILAMAIGIVGIAIVFFPVVKKQNEAIAVTYVSFRIIECLLLVGGPVAYLFLITLSKANSDTNFLSEPLSLALPAIILQMKNFTYQLAMIVLGVGSLFLCYSFYKSKIIPRFLAIWGFIGYVFLFLSAVLDMIGLIDTESVPGALMYIPGGLWEFIVLPIWLFVQGFKMNPKRDMQP